MYDRSIRFIIPITFLIFFAVGCGIHPPVDYTKEFALMERLGEENRAEKGREPGRVQHPAEQITPLSLPFDMDRSPSVALESRRALQVSETDKIAFALPLLRDFLLREQGISVRTIEKLEGRINGGDNIISINYSPKSLEQQDLLAEYLIICAAVSGFDESGSVDLVIGLVEEGDKPIPRIALQSRLDSYKELEGGKISYEDWTSKVEVRQLQEK